ncbi:MAG TPA: lytic transglycosylase domain-containing protein [Candidatus Binataceae bacterium]|nr:lytic transglycosylase domain-containing protein [Candidatus Binataceae bacterium]
MWGKLARVAAAALLLLVCVYGRSFAGAELSFPRPVAIEPNVKFWVDVFSSYGERDFVIHDRDNLWRVYQVMHIPGDGTPPRDETEAIGDYLKVKYANILNHLATGQAPASPEERRVAALFQGEPLAAYALAAQNLRVQQGLRERFQEGLLRSRYYRPTMERIFRAAGLPPELVTLAEVESGFYSRAKSGAGAVGIWQFTRSTGREYMRITRYHDDRLNPTTETAAAAKLLRSNYEELGNWPLAITAYNYGTGGMAEASSEFHGDYAQIQRNYAGTHFGFASKNYYPEFLAALQVHRYEDQYFPGLKYANAPAPPPVKTDFAPRRLARRSHGVHHTAAHYARNSQTHRVSVRHPHRGRRSGVRTVA